MDIHGEIIPTLIDELPMIAAMACFAEGDTIIRDAAELKVKESNRIAVMVESLSAMGADVEETEDGMIIHGGKPLHGAVIDSHLDHRIAMTFAVTAGMAEGETEILAAECVNISYPGLYHDLESLTREYLTGSIWPACYPLPGYNLPGMISAGSICIFIFTGLPQTKARKYPASFYGRSVF